MDQFQGIQGVDISNKIKEEENSEEAPVINKVFVQFPAKKITIENVSTVLQLKEKLFKETNMRTESQTLSFQGIILKDNNFLSQYRIENESVINFMFVMSGGGRSNPETTQTTVSGSFFFLKNKK